MSETTIPMELPDGPITDQKTGRTVGRIVDGKPTFEQSLLCLLYTSPSPRDS